MNMLLHGVKDSEFEIYHGDSLANDWDMLRETNPAKVPKFDAVVVKTQEMLRVGRPVLIGTRTVDASKKPYRIDVTATAGEDKGTKWHGVYEADGDTLRAVVGPAELVAGARKIVINVRMDLNCGMAVVWHGLPARVSASLTTGW